MHSILIVEDKASMAQMLKESLEAEGYGVSLAVDGQEGIERIKSEGFDLILTDLSLPKKDGLEVLKASKENNSMRPVIIMTAFGSIETAVEAMKQGAFDFITKPFNIDHLALLIGRALKTSRMMTENLLMREEFASKFGVPQIVGKSRAITEVVQNIRKAAATKATILLLGKSGTGKEIFARAAHYYSERRDYPFVPVNCAAIPKDLLESELFGFEKGAFTGAEARKLGKFELANKGTIFLDEIGELNRDLQAKLLRVLQEGEIDRVGGTKPVKLDVRILAASNSDLASAVEQGTFRDDLYYRINVFPIRIPNLNERVEDIPLLAEYFVSKFTADMKLRPKLISAEALEALRQNEWKGNVRELENAIERAVILCDGETIKPEHLLMDTRGKAPAPTTPLYSGAGAPDTEHHSLEETSKAASKLAESELIRKTLAATGGNKTKAAALLNVSYKTLLTKIKDYNLGQPL